MIHDPVFIVSVLLVLEGFVLWLAAQPRTSAWFNFLPPVFWIYFLPMMASSAGLIDARAPILGMIIANVLPMALFLLLVTVDLKAISRLGAKALGMFFCGSLGVVAGTLLAFLMVKGGVGGKFWSGFGALSASWIGGSANMIATREALGTPDNVFLPMVVVDTIVPYVWMGILIAGVRWQEAFDRWNSSDRVVLDELKMSLGTQARPQTLLTMPGVFLLGVCALSAGVAAKYAAGYLPQVKDLFSTSAWTIMVVSLIGLGASLTPARRLEACGASRVGYWVLYFVLTAIGAKASLSDLGTSVVLISAGGVIIVVHALFLLGAARLMRAPLFLAAAASQANIGGVASAPVVAAVYEPGLASVGLLLAILGNIVGTYGGILCGQCCRLFS